MLESMDCSAAECSPEAISVFDTWSQDNCNSTRAECNEGRGSGGRVFEGADSWIGVANADLIGGLAKNAGNSGFR